MNIPKPELFFTGVQADEYRLLKLLCPAAETASRKVAAFVAEWAPPGPTASLNLLEIGSGTGVTSFHLLQSRDDFDMVGIDNAPRMLSQARENLAWALAAGRLHLEEIDALGYLRQLPDASVDIIATAYTVHNFERNYRALVLAEIFRVLKPGGIFVNGDRYSLDDEAEHLRLIQAEARDYFRILLEMNRPDVLEQWILHLFSDESRDHVMPLTPALRAMESIGFAAVTVHDREGVNALVTGSKPWR